MIKALCGVRYGSLLNKLYNLCQIKGNPFARLRSEERRFKTFLVPQKLHHVLHIQVWKFLRDHYGIPFSPSFWGSYVVIICFSFPWWSLLFQGLIAGSLPSSDMKHFPRSWSTHIEMKTAVVNWCVPNSTVCSPHHLCPNRNALELV